MTTLGTFYRQTWWLWLLFAAALVGMSLITSLIFLLGIPVLFAYSVFFGMMRVAEIRRDEIARAKSKSKSSQDRQ
jgi:hypothetical protein